MKHLITILFIAFSITTNAQELFSLTGKVTDGNKAVPGASVLIKGSTKGVTTDF